MRKIYIIIIAQRIVNVKPKITRCCALFCTCNHIW